MLGGDWTDRVPAGELPPAVSKAVRFQMRLNPLAR